MPTIVPNQLNITINTSVPGFQKITYKPSMTIKDISKDDKIVQFDPLVKLNQTIIDKIPENLRKKQFFNKDLFKSLIAYTNANQSILSSMSSLPVKNLKQAHAKGYIDNNIKVTLNNIFPENSVIYIGDNPYVIADVQWTVGDMRIDTKKKEEKIDASKITDVALYQSLLKDEISEGQSQMKALEELDPNLIYGSNYSGPKKTSLAAPQKTGAPVAAQQVAPVTAPVVAAQQVAPVVAAQQVAHVAAQQPAQQPAPVVAQQPAPVVAQQPNNEPIMYPPESLIPSGETNTIRNIFDDTGALITGIFKNSDDEMKEIISDTLKNSTTIDIKEGANISSAVKQSVEGVQIMKTDGDGNCFFSAIAMAINYYNFYNQSNRIISKLADGITYGSGNNIFTPKYLRSLVYNYLTLKNLENLDELLENAAVSNAAALNEKFQSGLVDLKLNNLDTDEQYRKLASDIYKSNDNFLVQNVEAVPIVVDDYDAPFKPITKENLEKYILSNNYWANDIAINALCIQLELNIITFELMRNPEKPDRLRIPFANLLKNDKCNNWNKYLFLLLSNNHYELITFKYFQKRPNLDTITTIFNYTPNDLPPIYILFIIYGSYYKILTQENIRNFNFYPDIMSKIDSVVQNFKPYNKKLLEQYFQQKMTGGEKSISRTPYASEQIIKQPEQSQLAYYVTIDLQVYPGTSIPPNEIANLKCNNKWNAIRKAYSKLTGTPYVIPPIYNTKTLKNKEDESKNKTQNNRPPVQNNAKTLKNNYKGGKKTRTHKKR